MEYSEPEYLEIDAAMQERLERFREEHEGEPIGDVADRVLFEDDNVRIWEMKLEPGEHSDLHRHDHDYYLIILSGDLVAGVMPKDTTAPMPWFVGKVPPQGNTVGVPKGGTEWAYNVGEQTYHEFLVELKHT